MVIDITEPVDTTQMSSFHTYFQDAKEQVSERMEAQSSPGVYEHHQRTSADFGIHPYNLQFALEHDTLADLQGYTPKVDGSLHVVLETPALYTIESGSLVLISFLDHATLKNLDDTLHDADFFSAGASVILEEDATIASAGSIVPSAQQYTEDDDPLDPAHVAKTHYDAHGAGSIDDSMLADDTYSIVTSSPYYYDPATSTPVRFFSDHSRWIRGGGHIWSVDASYTVGARSVNLSVFGGHYLGTTSEVST